MRRSSAASKSNIRIAPSANSDRQSVEPESSSGVTPRTIRWAIYVAMIGLVLYYRMQLAAFLFPHG